MQDQQNFSQLPGERLTRRLHHELMSVLLSEAQTITHCALNLDARAEMLVTSITECTGKVIFSGAGKSGLVGKKIAATCSSLGIPSTALHAYDALHGDLGFIQANDLFIGISKSARGDELEKIYHSLKKKSVPTALICCCSGKLCEIADIVVQLSFDQEACQFGLAPTSSSTLTMAFGDALAIVASRERGITQTDYAAHHPAGTLGKQLAGTVSDFMIARADIPLVNRQDSFTTILNTISLKKFGLTIVIDHNDALQGIITDGDIRRACHHGSKVFELTAADIMTLNPKTIHPATPAYQALEQMEFFSITALIVVDSKNVVGLIHLHTLVKAGLR